MKGASWICKFREKNEKMKITRLKDGMHVYSNIVPLSELREMLKTTFAFCFFRVSTIYLPLRFWSALLEWKSRRAIKRFKKCFLIMFKYFKHENCATNPLRLGLWSMESLIHPSSGIRGSTWLPKACQIWKSNQKSADVELSAILSWFRKHES